METLTFITSNAEKVAQLARHLDYPVKHQSLDIPEIQSLDVVAVATQKAEAAFALVGSPVLIEDTALTFTALGKLPGPLIKWFLEELGTDGLCYLLRDNRAAIKASAGTRPLSQTDTVRLGVRWMRLFKTPVPCVRLP